MQPESPLLNRRQFLMLSAGIVAGSALPGVAMAARPAALASSRTILLKSIHTGEAGQFTYWHNGKLVAEEYARLNHLLRDHRSGEAESMDIAMIDQLYQLQQRHGKDTAFEVISGYRSPASNAMLRGKSGGVAKKSLHMQAKAIDIAMPGTSIRELHRSACALKAGGVGLYASSGFIHVDSGPVRYW